MDRFGVDKPDTRFGLEITDHTALLSKTDFRGLRRCSVARGVIRGITVPGLAESSRSEIAALEEVAKIGGPPASPRSR